MKTKRYCLIVSGGNIEIDFLSEYLPQFSFSYIIAVDKGLEAVHRLSLSPTHLVGDFDSVDKTVLDYYRSQKNVKIETLVPEKDDTDTEHAVCMALSLSVDAICMVGCTGTRLDHTLGNIHVLMRAFEQGVDAWLVDRHNVVRLIAGRFTVKKSEQFGTYISLFPFSGRVSGITLSGFKYPLSDASLAPADCYSLCVSNELAEDEGVIEIKEGVMVYFETRD